MFGTRCFMVPMAICAFATPAFSDGKLWLGSSIANSVLETDAGGKVAATIAQSGISGIAFDGANLYFEDGKGNITKRTADGISVLDTFQAGVPGKPAEDMAWDSKRQRLLRITRDNILARIGPVSHRIEKNLTLPNTSPKGLPGLLGEGLAYDAARDLIYVGFVSQASGVGGMPVPVAFAGGLRSICWPESGQYRAPAPQLEGNRSGQRYIDSRWQPGKYRYRGFLVSRRSCLNVGDNREPGKRSPRPAGATRGHVQEV
jgi:hypothetical protein